MKILVLGGSVFIGRQFVNTATAMGHQVTVFNRGRQTSEFADGVERLIGDRFSDLSALENRKWDVVIDTSGYLPSAVEATAKLLQNSVKHYVYISSLSVYGSVTERVDEETPVVVISDQEMKNVESLPVDESPTALSFGQHYGQLKAKCEEIVRSYYPENHLIVRPGVVAGPNDYSNRLAYWIERVKVGGQCLAPDNEQTPIRFIDVMDLAEWTLQLCENGINGIFNLPGQAQCFGEFLNACKRVLQSDIEWVWIDEPFLLEHQVQPWTEVPLWLPKSLQGFLRIGDEKAVANGLSYRSVEATLHSTDRWLKENNPQFKIMTGMEKQKEDLLLQSWWNAKQIEGVG